MIQIKVGIVDTDQIDIAVQTAVEGKVSHLGIYDLVGGIIHQNSDLGGIGDVFGDVHPPGRITAMMLCQLLSAHIYLGRGVGAPDLQIVEICFRQFGLLQGLDIQAGTAEIVIAAVKAVLGVPGVGQIDFYALTASDVGGVLSKQPVFIQI